MICFSISMSHILYGSYLTGNSLSTILFWGTTILKHGKKERNHVSIESVNSTSETNITLHVN